MLNKEKRRWRKQVIYNTASRECVVLRVVIACAKKKEMSSSSSAARTRRTQNSGSSTTTSQQQLPNYTDLQENYTNGPHQQTLDGLMDAMSDTNAAFSELAWANARQNGNHQSLIDKELPTWPPKDPHKAWGHTYPVQSKRGERVLGGYTDPSEGYDNKHSSEQGSSLLPALPFMQNPVVADRNLGESYELYDRYAKTNVDRTDGTLEAREYDLALDIAEKIAKGDTLTSTFYRMPGRDCSRGEPASYSEIPDLVEEESKASSGGSSSSSSSSLLLSQKRLSNLISEDQAYSSSRRHHGGSSGGGGHQQQRRSRRHHQRRQRHHQNLNNTLRGVAYDLRYWDDIVAEQNNDRVASAQFVFCREERWKYLVLVLVGLLLIGVVGGLVCLSFSSSSSSKKQ